MLAIIRPRLLSSKLLTKNLKIKLYRTLILPVIVTVWSKDFENINTKIDDNALKQVPKFKYRFREITGDEKIKKT